MKGKLRALLSRVTPTGSVIQQSVKSGAWLGATNVLSRGLQIAMIVVLANLLNPADFGLMGIGLLVLSGLQKFSELGLDAAVIQRKEQNADEYLNTMWSLQLARGAVLAGIILLLAPVVGSVFGEPRATDVVRVFALSPVLIALRNPAIVYFEKNLDFHLEFLYQVSGAVTRFVVSVGWALVSPTVWALVVGLVASEFVMFVFSYVASDYRPWPEFEWERARDLVNYGKWITANSVLYFLYGEGDDVVVGWLLSSTALGFYQTAYRLSNAPATEVSQVVSRVMFPTFSTIQDDTSALRQAYYRVLQVTMFVACPLAFGIAAVADVFVATFMGSEWLPIVTVMQVLAVYGLLRAFGKTYGPLWKATGRPDFITKFSALRVGLIAVLIVPGTLAFGIEGAALVIVGVGVAILPLSIYVLVGSIDGSYRRMLEEIGYPVLASSLMYAAVVLVQQQLAIESGFFGFLFLAGVGAAVYAALIGVFAFGFGWGIDKNLRSLLNAAT
jgi:PST family polysaccharide transporter/lipopolysaccharide exporter